MTYFVMFIQNYAYESCYAGKNMVLPPIGALNTSCSIFIKKQTNLVHLLKYVPATICRAEEVGLSQL